MFELGRGDKLEGTDRTCKGNRIRGMKDIIIKMIATIY